MARKPSPPDDESATPAFSRRSFLKTAGVGAAATTVVGVGARGEAAQILGPDAVTVSLKVNGGSGRSPSAAVTLLDALRNHLPDRRQRSATRAAAGRAVLSTASP
jgi:hypothetical protein